MTSISTLPTTWYADTVNKQFNKSQSHYIDIAKRYHDSINSIDVDKDWKQSVIDDALVDFKESNLNVKDWDDLQFCRSLTANLSLIDIDITLQRLLDVIHCANIIHRFDQLLVMPICVYEDKNRPGRMVCWDGQHTAVSLYIIARYVFKKNIDDIEVPIVVYNSNLKSDMRRCFIQLNGDGKKRLDNIDIVHQKIFGVRTDNSKNTDWLEVERKQQALESNKIFLTHDKFGDSDKPGAYSRLNEFIDTDYPIEITQRFAKYFFKICYSSRPVQPKESWMMYKFFELCMEQRIDATDEYITGVANSLKKAFNGNFDSNILHSMAKYSYQEWYRLNKPNPDSTLLGITYSEYKYCMPFLIAQIGKNFNGRLPTVPNAGWTVPQTDLL